MLLKCEDEVPGRGVQEIDPGAKFQSEARIAGGIHLRNDYYFSVAGHGQMTGLAGFVRDFFHQRARLGDDSLQRMVPVGEFKKFQRELETFVGQHLGNIAALGEANEHAENFADGPTEAASHLAGGQPVRFGGKQLQDVQPLVEGGSRVAGAGGTRREWVLRLSRAARIGLSGSLHDNFSNENSISYMQYYISTQSGTVRLRK